MVLKEACDFLEQLRMRYQKVLIGSRHVSGIGGSSMYKNIQGLQLEERGFICISKAGSNDKKGHLRILGGFLEHCSWVWDKKLEGYPMGSHLVQRVGSDQ